MKNSEKWRPGKYILKNKGLAASRNPAFVGPGSILVAELVAEKYSKYIPEFVHGRLLDLGCGTVPLYQFYREYTTENVCVDWANSLHENIHLDMECDLTGILPFGVGEFDTIILSDVLEHISNPALLWSEIARILAPGGNILLNTPFLYRIHEQPNDYFRYTDSALRSFAENEHLAVKVLESIGGSPDVLGDLVAKHIAVAPVLGKITAFILQKIMIFMGKTPPGRYVRIKSGKIFPLGYFMVANKPL